MFIFAGSEAFIRVCFVLLSTALLLPTDIGQMSLKIRSTFVIAIIIVNTLILSNTFFVIREIINCSKDGNSLIIVNEFA